MCILRDCMLVIIGNNLMNFDTSLQAVLILNTKKVPKKVLKLMKIINFL